MKVKLQGDGPVVLVDDDRDTLRLTKEVFAESRLRNELCLLDNGAALIKYLEEVALGQAKMPAVVLLDINMPEQSGFEVLVQIRTRAEFRDLPVIVMLTASNDSDDVERSFKYGANGYQVKPFGIDDFLNFINSLEP